MGTAKFYRFAYALSMKLFATILSFFALSTSAGDTCSITDYANRQVASWRTNCPSGCGIFEYLNEADVRINDHWKKVTDKFSANRNSQIKCDKMDAHGTGMHCTLEEILRKLKEIMENIKKEKDQFLEIRRVYRAGHISDIINKQRLSLAELQTQKSKLQIQLSDKQKQFKEEAAFCKVSFKQYDEEVCDILDHVRDY